MDGRLVDWDDAKVHVLTHTLHYGVGAFEGIRCYRPTAGRSAIFRLPEHNRRLFDSAKILGLKIPFSPEEIEKACIETVRANELETGYIRVSISRGVGLGLDPAHMNATSTIVISTEQLRLYPAEMYENGLAVVTASTRVPPQDASMKPTGTPSA